MKSISRAEIDFVTGQSVETLDTKLSVFSTWFKSLKNPYHGNKRKMLGSIFKTIEETGLVYDSFLDLFAGSGVVGATARYLGKEVTSNDLMGYAYHNARYLLEIKEPLSESVIDFIKHCEVKHVEPFVSKYYSDRFTEAEAQWLDRFRTIAFTMKADDDTYTLLMLSVLHHVIDRCFLGGRLNRGQVLAGLDHRIGHKRNRGREMGFAKIKWLTPFREMVDKPQGKSFRLDAVELLKQSDTEYDLCYIDPPYGGDQSDYFQMYHFFNDFISQKGERDDEDSCGKFVGKRDYENHFRDVLAGASCCHNLMISFSTNSFADITCIEKIVKDFRKRVIIKPVDYEYQYRKESKVSEFLIVAS